MEIRTVELDISKSKPGRTLTQFDLAEMEKILGAMPLYPYLVRMEKGGPPAGNHYHKLKKELLVCVEGRLKVVVEDIITKELQEIILNADQTVPSSSSQGVVIPANLAHVVENIGDATAGLLVFATSKARPPEDSFEYNII